jgi:hypothetical protein
MNRATAFTREQLRMPFTMILLVAVPVAFIFSAAGVLHDFSKVLGGSLAADAASGLAAGWASAFLSGSLGYFASSSSHGADRRLSLAGVGPTRVAHSRIVASMVLSTIAAFAAFLALWLRTGVAHPWHSAVAVIAFAWLYLGVGVVVGSLVSGALEGSLIVVFVFILDVFSGPGMAAAPAPWAISRTASTVLIAAGSGRVTSPADWVTLGATTVVALVMAFAVFAFSARRRS